MEVAARKWARRWRVGTENTQEGRQMVDTETNLSIQRLLVTYLESTENSISDDSDLIEAGRVPLNYTGWYFHSCMHA